MQDFDKIVWRDALTLIDFFATWCGPCQAMMAEIEKFQKCMNGRVDVYRVDIEDRQMKEIVERYGIVSVPTLIIFRRGEILWQRSGRVSYDELVEALDAVERRERVGQM